jgi:hypothetical protein
MAKPAQDARGRFISGNSGGGRPRGARNKLGEQFIEALFDDWQKYGATTIERVREQKPDQYLKVIASILPRDISLNVDPDEHLSDDQIVTLIRGLAAELRQHGVTFGDDDGDDDRIAVPATVAAHATRN